MSELDLLIREATQKDIGQLVPFMESYIVNYYQQPKPEYTKLLKFIENLLNHETGIQFLAFHQTQLIGFATLYFTYSTLKVAPVTIMNDLFVLESFRGKGIAAKLYKHCENYTKNNGFAYMSWIAATDNKQAQAFYKKMGAKQGNWIGYLI